MSSTIFERPDSDSALMHLGTVGNDRVIRQQLERILESSGFRNSKRYPNLLRHVVERTLAGKAGDLKERTLGIDVFGRDRDYDPTIDPVVRVSAGEIRKRIAQYYHEPGHDTEIRIDLPLGSYVPEFHFPKSKEHLLDGLPDAVIPHDAPGVIPEEAAPNRLTSHLQLAPQSSWRPRVGIAIAIGVIVAAVVWFRPWIAHSSALDQFWMPVLNPSVPVVLCVGRSPLPPGSLATPDQLVNRPSGIAWPDVVTLARLSGLIQSKGQTYQLRREERATFTELQEGPAILVGAFNDAWTLRLMDGMRFGFHQDGTAYWIGDQQDPASRRWKIDLSTKDPQGRPVLAEDYGLISRFLNPRTGRIVLIVAGLYGFGTEAAGRFLTDGRQMESLKGRVEAQWGKKNLQIVIGTEVIDRSPGPARVLATYSW